jgi:hypothetical protein
MPTTVAVRTVFNSSKTGIVGSNPIRSMARAIAQTVSTGFRPRQPRFDPNSGYVGSCGNGASFLREHRFPCQTWSHLLLHIHHHVSSGTRTTGPRVTDVSLHPMNKWNGWMSAFLLCCIDFCRLRPCGGSILSSRSPINFFSRVTVSEVNSEWEQAWGPNQEKWGEIKWTYSFNIPQNVRQMFPRLILSRRADRWW